MVRVIELAHARSGDKGNIANVGVVARQPGYYPLLREHLTAERVAEHFGELCAGPVERYELPNVHALNFLLHEALDGGGRESLRVDEIGKSYSGAILRLELDLSPDTVLAYASEER
jgi:hypothetical protein